MIAEIFYTEPFIEQDVNETIKTINELSPNRTIAHQDVDKTAKHHTLFVVRDNRQIIIAVATLVSIHLIGKCYGRVEDVVVRQCHRGKGIGEILMSKIVWFAQASGMAYLDLTSGGLRITANKLYQKLGFKKRDTNTYCLQLQ